MCGLVGVINKTGETVDKNLLQQANLRQFHRGPDAQNIYAEKNIGLGSTRLSILDLQERSNMPMISKDATSVLAYNGEIYNHRELISEFNLQCKTTSDTEVLLNLLSIQKEKAIEKLDGMFAFAVYFKESNKIIISRDRVGMKPLYYFENEDMFAFASEIKSILEFSQCNTQISKQGVYDVFFQGYNYGSTTPYSNIKSLRPGEYIEYDLDTNTYIKKLYYNLLHNITRSKYKKNDIKSIHNVQDELEKDLLSSIDKHCYSNANLGVICSGGVDSSLISVFAKNFRNDIDLFHAEIEGGTNEIEFARLVSEQIQAPLHSVKIGTKDYLENFVNCIYHNDVPSYHPNDVPMFLVCQLAKEKGKKVLLSGEGADELFGGYLVNLELSKRNLWKSLFLKVPNRYKKKLNSLFESIFELNMSPQSSEIISSLGLGSTNRISGILNAFTMQYANYERRNNMETILEQLNFMEPSEKREFAYITERLSSHLQTLLIRNDKMGMKASIETRLPFLSNTLIEKWINMPVKFKINGNKHNNLKFLLKNIAVKHLPKEIIYRPKIGFAIPINKIFTPNSNFFHNGFLCDFFSISTDSLMKSIISPDYFYRYLSMEVWGQIFIVGKGKEEVNNNFLSHFYAKA